MNVHGGNVEEMSRKLGVDTKSIIDFSANINPIGLSENVKKAMINAIDNVTRYPDITYYELKSAIANYDNIDKEHIILGNGAAEVIFNIVRALNPRKTLLCAPTFSEYEEAILSINGNIDYYFLKESNNFCIEEDYLERINEDIDLLFICNPNNPTGVLTNSEFIEKVVIKAKKNNCNVVIDESFLDFINNKEKYSAIRLLHKYENLIIVKSLTKFFAMPGIRIGYALTINLLIKKLINKVMVPWSINVVANDGVIVAVKDSEYIKRSKEYLETQKKYLVDELKKIGYINIFQPSVNFVMFKLLIDFNLKEEMLKKNILIRSCHNYKGLNDRFYRIAIRTEKENKVLIDTLKIMFDNILT